MLPVGHGDTSLAMSHAVMAMVTVAGAVPGIAPPDVMSHVGMAMVATVATAATVAMVATATVVAQGGATPTPAGGVVGEHNNASWITCRKRNRRTFN